MNNQYVRQVLIFHASLVKNNVGRYGQNAPKKNTTKINMLRQLLFQSGVQIQYLQGLQHLPRIEIILEACEKVARD